MEETGDDNAVGREVGPVGLVQLGHELDHVQGVIYKTTRKAALILRAAGSRRRDEILFHFIHKVQQEFSPVTSLALHELLEGFDVLQSLGEFWVLLVRWHELNLNSGNSDLNQLEYLKIEKA
jgi:hypothetical protein